MHDWDALSVHEPAIRGFLEDHLVDEVGLVRSHLNAATLRPWTNADFADQDTLPYYRRERGDPAGQLGYEDSLMATGEYAESQVHRFAATADPAALATAAQQVSALLRVFWHGEFYELGFLPKPHGGLRRAAYSHEISPDQYLKTIIALRAWQPYAPPSQQRGIDRCLVAVADYFLHRNFQHPYRERTLVNPETRPHCLTLYLPILQIARKLTGEEKYTEALSGFEAALDRQAAGEMEQNFNLCSLFCEGYQLAWQEGLRDERLPATIRAAWALNLELVLPDGRGLQSRRIPVPTSGVIRMAALAPLVDQHFPELGARSTAVRILGRHTDPQAMTYFAEHDPRWIQPGHEFLSRSICETSLSSWLVGYWRLRRRAAERERQGEALSGVG